MFFEALRQQKILPIITVNEIAQTRSTVSMLKSNGLNIIEITLRTPRSLEALEEFCKDSDLVIGAGSISNVDQLEQVVSIGAKFGVSPGIFEPLVIRASQLGLPYIPGVATPSEIMTAINLGVNQVKFFPSETLGGIAALKSLSAPFPTVSFIPTGGINAENYEEYLKHKFVLAVGGTWLT